MILRLNRSVKAGYQKFMNLRDPKDQRAKISKMTSKKYQSLQMVKESEDQKHLEECLERLSLTYFTFSNRMVDHNRRKKNRSSLATTTRRTQRRLQSLFHARALMLEERPVNLSLLVRHHSQTEKMLC